jgi:HK97 family phage prohead protease
MLVKKTLSLIDCAIKTISDAGTFSGYASVFGGVDSYGDTILRGAFGHTLSVNGLPKMFFGHQWGAMPIGKWTKASEDDHGLFVEGELTPGQSDATNVHAALKHGTLDGLSIGGYLAKNDWQESADGGRIISRWSSLMEVSPVVFPADSNARINLSSVKSEEFTNALTEITTIRDFERLLRDVGAFDQATAKQLVAKAKDIFKQRDVDDDAEAKTAELVFALRKYLPR